MAEEHDRIYICNLLTCSVIYALLFQEKQPSLQGGTELLSFQCTALDTEARPLDSW